MARVGDGLQEASERELERLANDEAARARGKSHHVAQLPSETDVAEGTRLVDEAFALKRQVARRSVDVNPRTTSIAYDTHRVNDSALATLQAWIERAHTLTTSTLSEMQSRIDREAEALLDIESRAIVTAVDHNSVYLHMDPEQMKECGGTVATGVSS